MLEEKLTQGKLERLAGFSSRGYVNRLLAGTRGKRPSHDVVQRLAKILRVREEWLVAGEGPMRTPYGELAAREKAMAAAKEHGVLHETFAELEARHPVAQHGEEPALWWLERIIELNKEVRLRLAEEKTVKRVQSLARKVNEQRKHGTRPEAPAPPGAHTGTHGRHK